MAKVGPRRAGRSSRGRGQRRPTTWEISDSDTEGPVGAEADSEAAVRARNPAEERRAAAEALRLLRPEQALRRLAVRVDPGEPEGEGRGPGRSSTSTGARALKAPLNHWKVIPGPLWGERGILALSPAFQLGSLIDRLWHLYPIALLEPAESVCL